MNELLLIFNPIEHEDRLRIAEQQLYKAEKILQMVENDPSLDPRLKEEIVKQTLPPAPTSELPPLPPPNDK